jgi:hypothetical protein
MKRTDIRAGVVYAVRSSYGPPVPVVFLEDGAAGLYGRDSYGRGPYRRLDGNFYKATAGKGLGSPARGYAALERNGGSGIPNADAAELLRAADPVAELARFLADGKPSAEGLRFAIVTSLGQIGGPYDEELAAYSAAKDAERERRRRIDEERAAESARRQDIVEALSASASQRGTTSAAGSR